MCAFDESLHGIQILFKVAKKLMMLVLTTKTHGDRPFVAKKVRSKVITNHVRVNGELSKLVQ